MKWPFLEVEKLYQKCLSAPYRHVEEDADYYYEVIGDTLYLYFQCSSGEQDWKNNFKFFSRSVKAYHDMPKSWRCHRGFLLVWKAIEPYIKDIIVDPTVKNVYIMGYSHGAAIASLCHEYVWFNRPDLRDGHLYGFGCGCPRIFASLFIPKDLRERWETFYPIRNHTDIVTHLPPKFVFYTDVNKVVKIGEKKHYNCVRSHYPDKYIESLQEKGTEEIN